MQEKTACIDLYQEMEGEVVKFNIEVSQEDLDKMSEIREREPEVDWTNRQMDLLFKASEELKAEKEQNQPQESPEQSL